jgi:hypothetical protein
MNQPVATGGVLRDHLEVAAGYGNTVAQAMLKGPECPPAFEYLWIWYMELRVGAGEGLNGIAPLTWTEVESWSHLTRTLPYPHEIKALFQLDLVARNPEAFKEEK